MKKVLYLISLILSINLFFSLYTNESEKQFREISYLSTEITENTEMESFSTIINLDQENDFSRVYNYVFNYIKSSNYLALSVNYVNDPIEKEKELSNIYLYAEKNIIPTILNIDSQRDVVLTSSTEKDYYSTNQEKETNRLLNVDKDIFTIKAREFQIFPYYVYSETRDTNFNISIYTNNLEDAMNDFSNYLSENNIKHESSVNSYSESITDNSYLKTIFILSIITMLSYFMVIISVVLKEDHRIRIYRLHGYSNTRIVKCLFLKSMLLCNFIFIITICILTTVKCHPFNISTTQLLKNNLFVCLLFILLNLFILIFTTFYISSFSKYSFSKKNIWLKSTQKGMNFFKITLVFFILSSFVFSFTSSLLAISKSIDLRNLLNQDYLSLFSSSEDMYSNDATLKELTDKTDIVYCNFSKTEFNRLFPDRNYTPLIEVNEEYLKEYDIQHTDEDLKDFTSNDSYVLMPKKYKGKSINLPVDLNYFKIYYIENSQTFYCLSPTAEYLHITDPVIVVKSNTDLIPSDVFRTFLPLDEIHDIAYYQQIFNNHVQENSYTLITNLRQITQLLKTQETLIINNTTILFILSSVFVIYIYLNLALYVNNAKREIIVKTFHGYSSYLKYREVYILAILTNFIPCLCYCFMNTKEITSTLMFFIFITLIELLITSYVLMQFERKGIIDELKGE